MTNTQEEAQWQKQANHFLDDYQQSPTEANGHTSTDPRPPAAQQGSNSNSTQTGSVSARTEASGGSSSGVVTTVAGALRSASNRGLNKSLTLDLPLDFGDMPMPSATGLMISPKDGASPTDQLLMGMLSPSDFQGNTQFLHSPSSAMAVSPHSATGAITRTLPSGNGAPANGYDGQVDIRILGASQGDAAKAGDAGAGTGRSHMDLNLNYATGAATAYSEQVQDLPSRMDSLALTDLHGQAFGLLFGVAQQQQPRATFVTATHGSLAPAFHFNAAAHAPPTPSFAPATGAPNGSAPTSGHLVTTDGFRSPPQPPRLSVPDISPTPSPPPGQYAAGAVVETGAGGSIYDSLISPMPEAPRQMDKSKRDRDDVLELTFEAYEKKYNQKAARCTQGSCAEHCSTPCDLHTCKCCKKNRQMDIEGVQRHRKYCGPCMRREKVDGLDFVKCGFTVVIDGVEQTCGVEMLKDVFDNHWKQHRSDASPQCLTVPSRQGRKCGTCTNMRPITYYAKRDTNCSCTHCQLRKTEGRVELVASDSFRRTLRASNENLSGQFPELSSGDFAGGPAVSDVTGVRPGHVRRLSMPGNSTASFPRSGPLGGSEVTSGALGPSPLGSASVAAAAAMAAEAIAAAGDGAPAGAFTSPGFQTNLARAINGMGAVGVGQGGYAIEQRSGDYASPWVSQSAPSSARHAWSPNGSFNAAGGPNNGAAGDPAILQQARAIGQSVLGAAVVGCPSFRLLIGRWHEAQNNPGPVLSNIQGALTALLRAVQHVEDECQQIIMTSTTEDLQNTLANGNALLSMQPQQQAQQGQQQA